MLQFKIQVPNKSVLHKLRFRMPHQAHAGAGAFLLKFAEQLALVQQNPQPSIQEPHVFLFAGDHNICQEVNQEVHSWAARVVNHWITSRSPSAYIVRKEQLKLKLVDACIRFPLESTVDYWIHRGDLLLAKNMRLGTKSFLHEAAMSSHETHKAIATGAAMAEEYFYKGVNFVMLGHLGEEVEMSCYALSSSILQKKASQIMELYDEQQEQRAKIISRALNRHPESRDPFTQLSVYGGYDIAMMMGFILKAAEKHMLITIDDFASTVALALAHNFHPEVLNYVWIGQGIKNKTQRMLLERLGFDKNFSGLLPHADQLGLLLTYTHVKYATALIKGGEE